MSTTEKVLDICLSLAAIAIGSGALISVLVFGQWLLGVWQLQECASKHNVYQCVFVATPVRSGATE